MYHKGYANLLPSILTILLLVLCLLVMTLSVVLLLLFELVKIWYGLLLEAHLPLIIVPLLHFHLSGSKIPVWCVHSTTIDFNKQSKFHTHNTHQCLFFVSLNVSHLFVAESTPLHYQYYSCLSNKAPIFKCIHINYVCYTLVLGSMRNYLIQANQTMI